MFAHKCYVNLSISPKMGYRVPAGSRPSSLGPAGKERMGGRAAGGGWQAVDGRAVGGSRKTTRSFLRGPLPTKIIFQKIDVAQGSLFENATDEQKRKEAFRWILIALTRPIDSTVITLRDKDSELGKILQEVKSAHPSFVNWYS